MCIFLLVIDLILILSCLRNITRFHTLFFIRPNPKYWNFFRSREPISELLSHFSLDKMAQLA